MEKWPKTFNQKENSKKETDPSKRKFLGSLAVLGGAVLAPSFVDAKEKKEESLGESKEDRPQKTFEDWKSDKENSDNSLYTPYEKVSLSEDGERNLKLASVRHTAETIVQNFEEIETEIKKSTAVILEYFNLPGETSGLRNLDIGTAAIPIAAGSGELKDDVLKSLYENKKEYHAEVFFGAVAGIAAREGKDIIVVNPENKKAEGFSAAGGTLAAISSLLALGILDKKEKEAIKKSIKNKEAERKMSRRSFLKKTAAVATAVTATYAGVNMIQENAFENNYSIEEKQMKEIAPYVEKMETAGIIKKADPGREKLEKLKWCMHDWRDASNALGILKMAESDREDDLNGNLTEKYFKNNNPALLLQGAAHSKVLAYLRDPEKAKERMKLYSATFNIVGDFDIRRYRFDKEKSEFKLVSEESYF